jgi:hypothetical protein
MTDDVTLIQQYSSTTWSGEEAGAITAVLADDGSVHSIWCNQYGWFIELPWHAFDDSRVTTCVDESEEVSSAAYCL